MEEEDNNPHPIGTNGAFWSLPTIPEDIHDWPTPALRFRNPTHHLKAWSFDPNHVPPHLIPSGCHDAGNYPLKKAGTQANRIDDVQKKQRGDFLRQFSNNPIWAAQSFQPYNHYICQADEDGPLQEIEAKRLKRKKRTANEKKKNILW